MVNFNYQEILNNLSKSKFRSSFHLSSKDKEYIRLKGLPTIKIHAYEFIMKRLAPKIIPNDGKQTPYKGHPVFISQHHCACCCRKCLNKWYHIPLNTQLTNKQVDFIVNLIMAFIDEEMKK